MRCLLVLQLTGLNIVEISGLKIAFLFLGDLFRNYPWIIIKTIHLSKFKLKKRWCYTTIPIKTCLFCAQRRLKKGRICLMTISLIGFFQVVSYINYIDQCEPIMEAIYCSDFRYESNGIFVLGVGFFFFRQISTF